MRLKPGSVRVCSYIASIENFVILVITIILKQIFCKMANKGGGKSCKSSKKDELDIKVFAYDVLCFTLPPCGFPETKLEYGGEKKNTYVDGGTCVSANGSLLLCIAFTKRDIWRAMFESRLKSSGLETSKKIEEYMAAFFEIHREYEVESIQFKIIYSLAAYNEIMLFLNYKCIELNFQQLLDLWTNCFNKCKGKLMNDDLLLRKLFTQNKVSANFVDGILYFARNFASPYGKRDDVSKLFRYSGDQLTKMIDVSDKLTMETSEESPALPSGFESSFVLLVDLESPEPTSFIKVKKIFKNGGANSMDVSESRQKIKTTSGVETKAILRQTSSSTGKSPRKNPNEKSEEQSSKKKDVPAGLSLTLPLGFEPPTVLPGDHESPTPPSSTEEDSAVQKKTRNSRTESTGFTGKGHGIKMASKQEIKEQPVCPDKSPRKNSNEKSKEQRFNYKDVASSSSFTLPVGFESPTVLLGDHESPTLPSSTEKESIVPKKTRNSRTASTGLSGEGYESKMTSKQEIKERPVCQEKSPRKYLDKESKQIKPTSRKQSMASTSGGQSTITAAFKSGAVAGREMPRGIRTGSTSASEFESGGACGVESSSARRNTPNNEDIGEPQSALPSDLHSRASRALAELNAFFVIDERTSSTNSLESGPDRLSSKQEVNYLFEKLGLGRKYRE